jgi:hypothetical protein
MWSWALLQWGYRNNKKDKLYRRGTAVIFPRERRIPNTSFVRKVQLLSRNTIENKTYVPIWGLIVVPQHGKTGYKSTFSIFLCQSYLAHEYTPPKLIPIHVFEIKDHTRLRWIGPFYIIVLCYIDLGQSNLVPRGSPQEGDIVTTIRKTKHPTSCTCYVTFVVLIFLLIGRIDLQVPGHMRITCRNRRSISLEGE